MCKTRNNLTPHHMVYRSHGGGDCTTNLLTLCMACHDGVHAAQLKIIGIDADKPLIFERNK